MTNMNKINDLSLAFGCAGISGSKGGYSFGDISEQDALSVLNLAKDRGVYIYDTAPIYGFGDSERRLGKAFKSCPEDVFIISKSGVSWHENQRVNMTNDPKETQKMLEDSLRRLERDYIDLYMIHWPDKSVDIRYPLEVLMKAKEAQKIKHIGLCNTHLEDLKKARQLCEIEFLQSQFNFFVRDELELLSKEMDCASFMSWGTLDKGILSSTVSAGRKYDKSDARSWAPWWKSQDNETRFKIMSELEVLFKEYNCSSLDFAVAFNLSQKDLNHVLIGIKTEKQLESALAACEFKIEQELLDKAEKIYQRLWH